MSDNFFRLYYSAAYRFRLPLWHALRGRVALGLEVRQEWQIC